MRDAAVQQESRTDHDLDDFEVLVDQPGIAIVYINGRYEGQHVTPYVSYDDFTECVTSLGLVVGWAIQREGECTMYALQQPTKGGAEWRLPTPTLN